MHNDFLGKKVLMLGGSYSATPYIIALKKKGVEITLMSKDPQEPGHQYADISLYEDYSKSQNIFKACQETLYDFLVPSCNDYAYLSAAIAADKYKFTGYDTLETVNILHNKDAYRNFLLLNNLPSPRQFKKDDILKDGISGSLLVKPTDSFSGKGISHIYNKEDLDKAILRAQEFSRNGTYTIEEYVSGNLYSHSAFIENGCIKVDFFVDEYCTTYQYQVDASCHPSSLSESIKDKVRKEIEKKVELLNLCDGLLHTQFIADSNSFWFIETMRRAPGDLYGRLIWHSTGYPYHLSNLNQYLDIHLLPPEYIKSNKPILRHTISAVSDISPIGFQIDFKHDWQETIPLCISGHKQKKAPFDKQAILFIGCEDNTHLWTNTGKINENISLISEEREHI